MRTFVIAAALAASLGGCTTAEPAGENRSNIEQRAFGEGAAPVVGVRKIMTENGKLLGYLKAMEDNSGRKIRGKAVMVFWVYNDHFKPLGFYTERGVTYRLATDPITGQPEFKTFGEHDVDDSKRLLLGLPAGTPVQLAAMDEPRTLESDAEAAAAAKAKAAAQAPKPAADAGAPASPK